MKVERHSMGLCSLLERAARPLVLVPTMGGLHEGHMSLVRLARRFEGTVIVSLFVNPTQFSLGEDFESYPRTFADDLDMLRDKCDILFAPSTSEMYPEEQVFDVSLPPLASELCGATRPNFFSGIALVVAKLFNMTRPDIAVFGKKDYQQATLISQMVSQMGYPVRIELGPIVREPDGLAMSSRNAYLGPDERSRAPEIWRTVSSVAEAAGRAVNPDALAVLCQEEKDRLAALGFESDYLEIRSAAGLARPRYSPGERLVVLCAAVLGKCRLIDNCEVRYAGISEGSG